MGNSELTLLDHYIYAHNDDTVISYQGPVNEFVLSKISEDLRSRFLEQPKTGKKVFSIFIELAQNIQFYSEEKAFWADHKDSVGALLITEHSDRVTCSCGNLVSSLYVDELIENITKINSLDHKSLRQYKRQQRNREKPTNSRSKGAGIGLIQIAILSGNPLLCSYRKVSDDFSLFALSVDIPATKEIEE